MSRAVALAVFWAAAAAGKSTSAVISFHSGNSVKPTITNPVRQENHDKYIPCNNNSSRLHLIALTFLAVPLYYAAEFMFSLASPYPVPKCMCPGAADTTPVNPNPNPIHSAVGITTLVNTTTNGKLYELSSMDGVSMKVHRWHKPLLLRIHANSRCSERHSLSFALRVQPLR